MSFFVFVGDGRHMWRFVHFAEQASTGDDAIQQAWIEAIDLGTTPEGSYMAVSSDHITTRDADQTAHATAHEGTERD